MAEFQPRPPKLPKTAVERDTQKRIIIVIERANLETAKVGKEYQLLNCDDHQNILRKNNRDIADSRPDISHQVLFAGMNFFPIIWMSIFVMYMHTSFYFYLHYWFLDKHNKCAREQRRAYSCTRACVHTLRAFSRTSTSLILVSNARAYVLRNKCNCRGKI